MKSRISMFVTALILFAALAMPVQLAAQHTRYKLIDIPTLGGPSAFGNGNGPGNQLLNNAGIVVGIAETSAPDPNAPNCANPDCFLSHAFRWQKGVLTDLGTLPGGNFSGASAINARGWIAGGSTTAEIDPFNSACGFQPLCPQFHGVLWKDDKPIDLGTLGTGLESNAVYVNNGGEVVGFSTINTTPDPFSFLGAPTHAFIWRNGVMRDLGTLGGPDSFVASGCNNERTELVAGSSSINSTPNLTTGLPTTDPFLWKNGTMIDLGTLGGTNGGAQCANNRGQVTGTSNLAGDSTFHPFFWDRGVLTNMGTLGGDNGFPTWINDAGEVVGRADLPGLSGSQLHHAFLWENGGPMMDLGSLGTNSTALSINSKGQIVGASRINATTNHAFLWEDGGPMIDLNTLIPANSSLQLVGAFNINDRGEITGLGAPPGVVPFGTDAPGLHAFLLIPCGAGEAPSCEDNAVASTAATQNSPAPVTKSQTTSTQGRPTPSGMAAERARLAQRYHIPGLGTPKD